MRRSEDGAIRPVLITDQQEGKCMEVRALQELRAGRIVVLVDSALNQADLVAAAELTDPATVAQMARIGRGIIAVALDFQRCEQLGLSRMVSAIPSRNPGVRELPLISVEARDGISTGISAADRARTIRLLAAGEAASQLVSPGHVFPVPAAPGGLLARRGRIEAAVDAVALAGRRPVASICDLLDEDGSVADTGFAAEVAERHGLARLEVDQLVELRLASQWQSW